MLKEFLNDVLLDEFTTCITDDPGCRGGRFYEKDFAIDYLTKVKSTHFFTPGLFSLNEKKRFQKNVQVINCLWLDYDGNQKVDLPFLESRKLPLPSYTFKREDRFHIYYILDNPYILTDPIEFSKWFRNFSKWCLADSSTVATVQSFMRVPGTLWQKHGKTANGYEPLAELTGKEKYSIDYFIKLVEQNFREKDFEKELTRRELSKLIKKTNESTDAIKKLLFFGQNPIPKGHGRSKALYNISCRCWDFGLDLESAIEIVNDFNKLFCVPEESYEIVIQSLESAYKYAQGEFGSLIDESGDGLIKEIYLRKKLTDSLNDWYYVLEAEQLRNPKNGKMYTTQSQIKNALASITGTQNQLHKIIAKNCIKIVDRANFLPGVNESIIDKEYYREINSYIPLKKIDTNLNDEKAGKDFLDHIKYLTTSKEEFQHVVKWIKHLFLKPHVKIKHSLLFITEEGTGKTILSKFFEKVLVSINDLSYVTSLSSKEILDGHNSKLDSKLLCITNELEGLITYSSQKDFKSWITDDTINISNKYMRGYNTSNYCNFISFSNSDNAAFIKKGDRRFFVIQNRTQPREPEYYKNLFYILENKYNEIYNYIINYEIKELDPYEPPPMTAGKELVQEISKPELTKILEELYESGKLKEVLGNFFTAKKFIDLCSVIIPQTSSRNLTYNKVHFFCQYKEISYFKEDFSHNGERIRINYFSFSGERMGTQEILEFRKKDN